ncbi:MAG: putative Ig domain-containing protein, partial [Blastocatellia bacterium]
AFVFVRNGAVWTQQQKLTDANGAAGDDFGHSVAISGDTAVIGAPFDNVGGNPDQGSAFVFVRGGATWTQQQKLTNDDGGAFDAFGFSVAISGDLAVVGAIRTPGIASLGSAHVFARSGETWTQQQKLGASNAFYFGYSVGISGDTALIGTISDSAYVFAGAACPAITLNPAALPNGTAGSPYNQSITASGGAGPYNYAVSSGTLPAGLTLDPTTGSLSGLPAAAGTFNFTVTATGGNLCPGSRDYALVIACRTINVTPANPTLPPAEAGAPYNRTVTATGGLAPYSFSIGAGALPAGITLNAATGVLSGTPTVTGVFSFEVRATDGFGCFGSGAYSLTVNCPRITVAPGNSNLPNGALGTVYNQTFSATGGIGAYRFDVVTGALPAGLTLNASSGVLSGTPTARNTFNFIIRATDGAGCTGRSPYRIVVN